MSNVMKLSKETDEKLFEIKNHLNLPSKAAVARICVALSLNKKGDFVLLDEVSSMISIDRNTLTGDNDDLIKAMIIQFSERELSDDDYFPRYFYSHFSRGLEILHSDYRLIKDKERLIRRLIK